MSLLPINKKKGDGAAHHGTAGSAICEGSRLSEGGEDFHVDRERGPAGSQLILRDHWFWNLLEIWTIYSILLLCLISRPIFLALTTSFYLSIGNSVVYFFLLEIDDKIQKPSRGWGGRGCGLVCCWLVDVIFSCLLSPFIPCSSFTF